MTTIARTFHQDAHSVYSIPNDAPEHERLEEQFRYMTSAMGGKHIHTSLSNFPSTTALRVIDVGCGTGVATDLLAGSIPQATVYGLDLTPTPQGLRPDRHNVCYLRGNVLTQTPSQWTLVRSGSPSTPSLPLTGPATSSFDLVFSRLLVAGMTDWPAYLATAYSLLKPGASLELQEWSCTLCSGPPEYSSISENISWLALMRDGLCPAGIDLELDATLPDRVHGAGFTDIQTHLYHIPMSADAVTDPSRKAMGAFFQRNCYEALGAMITRAGRDAAKSPAETAAVLEDFRQDMYGRRGNLWGRIIVITARKPLAA